MSPANAERRTGLLDLAASRPLTTEEIGELGALEAEHHEFRRMCMRTAPLNPMALGYRWDETLMHSAAPAMTVKVRTGGDVEMDGETMTLMEATRRVAASVRRGIALADWSGRTGRLGDIAGLEHPPRAVTAKSATTADAAAPAKPRAAPAAMGDLFD